MSGLTIEFKRIVPSLGLVTYQFSDGRSVYIDCNDGRFCFCECHIPKCEHFKLARKVEIATCTSRLHTIVDSTQKRSRV